MRATRSGAALIGAALAAALVFAFGSNAATVTLPCGSSLPQAYASAPAEGVIYQLGACAYTGGTFAYKPSQAGTVEYEGIAGTTVGGITVRGAKHVTVRNLKMGGVFATPQNGSSSPPGSLAEDWTFDGVNMDGGVFFLRSAVDFEFLNGQSGNTHNAVPNTIGNYDGPPSQNILIRNWRIHDMDRSACSGCHMEGLFIQEAVGVQVIDSVFERVSIMDIFVHRIGTGTGTVNGKIGDPRDLVFRGNRFDAPNDGGGGAVVVRVDGNEWTDNVRFDGNQWGSRMWLERESGAAVSNFVWCSNNTGAAPAFDSTAGVTVNAYCGEQPPPTTTTTEEPPPPPVCDQACVVAYEARIDALEADLAVERQHSAELQAKIDAALEALQ